MSTEVAKDTEFSISIEYDGFTVGKFPEDKPVNFCKPQKCWVNQCWVITPGNENNPILFNFYSKDKERIECGTIMALAGNIPVEDLAKIYKSKGCPIFNVCWDDFLPYCGMFMIGGLSATWRFYCILKTN